MSAASHDDPPRDGEEANEGDAKMRIPVGEERVVVDKSSVEQVAAHIGVRTQTYDVPVSEILRTERIDVQRIPVDRIVPEAPQTRVEDGVTIIPVVEEILVRQYRVIEEVRVSLLVDEVEQTETVSLRRQEVVVEDLTGDEPPQDGVPRNPSR
ncbi:MAG: DUF2382 domain-containing protein [Jannaschia sp.]